MLTGSSSSPFAYMESAMYHMLFARPATYSPLADEGSQASAELQSPKTPNDASKSSVPDTDGSPSRKNKLQNNTSAKAKKADQEEGKDLKRNKKTNWSMFPPHFQIFIVFFIIDHISTFTDCKFQIYDKQIILKSYIFISKMKSQNFYCCLNALIYLNDFNENTIVDCKLPFYLYILFHVHVWL